MKKLSQSKVGDTIIDKLGGKCKILGRCGAIIFRSEFNRYEIAAYHFMTWMEAEKEGWKIIDKSGREPISRKELERLMPNVKITK